MGLMNALISEFSERKGLNPALAATLLSDIGIRDYVLEFHEVLERYAAKAEKLLKDHLRVTAESRQEKAHWSRHWSSG